MSCKWPCRKSDFLNLILIITRGSFQGSVNFHMDGLIHARRVQETPEICTNSTREELAACWDSPTASQGFPWHFSFKPDSRKRFGTWSVPRQTLPSSSNYKHRIIAMHFLHVSSMWLRPPPHKQSQSTHCMWSLALSPRWCRLKGVQGSRPSIPWNPGLGACEAAPEGKCCEILLVAEVKGHSPSLRVCSDGIWGLTEKGWECFLSFLWSMSIYPIPRKTTTPLPLQSLGPKVWEKTQSVPAILCLCESLLRSNEFRCKWA